MDSGRKAPPLWFSSSFSHNICELSDVMNVQTDNILAPMITHGIYSAVVLGHGLCKIHDHRRKLRQRIQQVRVETKNNNL